MEYLLILGALLLAFSNGANDNFKGFATVWGADTLTYGRALALATAATLAGSLLSLVLADGLVQQFSGKGLVPDSLAGAPAFVTSVGGGAAVAVLIATRVGLPVSTTHALIGALVGAGLALGGGDFQFSALARSFLLPLLISPLVAGGLGLAAYRLFRLRPAENDCACLTLPVTVEPAGAVAVRLDRILPAIVVAPAAACRGLPAPAARFSIGRLLDHAHVLSAISICFARAVNDTPKLAALLAGAQILGAQPAVMMVAAMMAVGGLVFARRVAETMSRRVTRIDATQGLAANLITASLVLFASNLGLPVSTTHVSVGSIVGAGASAGTIDWSTARAIVLSWLATLPVAASVAWGIAMAVGS